MVLATNIAETSLTIEGIRPVVDSAERVARFDPRTGLTRLVTQRISRIDDAACRTRRSSLPGICLHLLGKEQAERAAAQSEPEILHSDLSALLLELLQWGCHDPAALAAGSAARGQSGRRAPAGGVVGAGRRAAVGVWPQNGSAWQRAAAGGDAGRADR